MEKDGTLEEEKQQFRMWLAIGRERRRCRYQSPNPYQPKPVGWLPQPQVTDGTLELIS